MRAATSSWREILRRQRASGVSAAAFCRQTGISVSSFYAGRRRVENSTGFAEVQVIPAERAGAGIDPPGPDNRVSGVELRLPDGCGVALQHGFDGQTLADLLAVLRRSTGQEASA